MEAIKVTNDKRRAEAGSRSPAPSNEDQGEQIARRAYELWQARGCPAGDDLSDWLQAEREVAGEATPGQRS